MNNNQQLVAFVVGGVIFLIIAYPMRDYLVLALVGAGAIQIYNVINNSNSNSNHRNHRR